MTTQIVSPKLTQRTRYTRKWIRRFVITVIGLMFGLTVLGFSYEKYAEAQDAQNYPPPGIMVEAGGFDLHLNIMGEKNDRPTVILEAGNGGFSSQWVNVQTVVAEYTQVVSYDRAGLGWSEDSGQPRDVITAARQLHTALQNARVEAPYVLVGHSLGGLFVRAFAHEYPDEVVGVVMVDTAHPDAFTFYPQSVEQAQHTLRQFADIAAAVSPIGVFRLTGPIFAEGIDTLPVDQAAQTFAIGVSPRYLRALSAEYHTWWPTMNDQVRQMDDLGNRPLIVLSANTFPAGSKAPDGYWEAHFAMQEDIAALSTNGELRIVEGATHYSLIMDKTVSQHVIDAIHDIHDRTQH